MGVPILMGSPDGEASAILEAEKVGLHVPAEDPAALADAIKKLADEPSLRKNFTVNCLAAAPNHSREVQAQNMLAVLQMLAPRK